MKEGILQHAAMAVALELGERESTVGLAGQGQAKGTYERTKRSRFNHLGFLGLNVMNLLKRTWATGAMPLRAASSLAEEAERVRVATGRAQLTWEHRGVPSCC